MPEVVAKQFETAVSIGETALADLDRAQATARSTSADDAKQAEGEDADSLWQDVAGKLVAEQMGSQVSFSNTHVLQQTLKATARDMNEQHKTVRAPRPPTPAARRIAVRVATHLRCWHPAQPTHSRASHARTLHGHTRRAASVVPPHLLPLPVPRSRGLVTITGNGAV